MSTNCYDVHYDLDRNKYFNSTCVGFKNTYEIIQIIFQVGLHRI